MKIKFLNNTEFDYLNAYAIEKDIYDGEIRQSIEVEMPLNQTSYEEISNIINNKEIINYFTLKGDDIVYEDGSAFNPPENIYKGYVYGDKIIVENGIITFKKYKASPMEIENNELKNVIDELLIAMEV